MAATRSIASTMWNCRPTVAAKTSTCSPPGCANVMRIAVATPSAEALGTRAGTSRGKWTRHRSKDHAIVTAAMGALSPVRASGIHQRGAVHPLYDLGVISVPEAA